MATSLTVYVDGSPGAATALAFSAANECTLRFPAGSQALDARASTVRCVITDADTQLSLADVTARLGHGGDEWVNLPGSRPIASCTLEAGHFTVCIDVRADVFLPAVLTAVRVLRHSHDADRTADDISEAGHEAAVACASRRCEDDSVVADGDDEASWRTALAPAPFAQWLRGTPLRVPAAQAWHSALPCAARRAALQADAMLLADTHRSCG